MNPADDHEGGAAAPSGSVSALEITGLRVERGGSRLLDGVDLHVNPGEWVMVIGPNGAGKSTLLRAVCGLLPASGTVTVFGTALGRLSRRALARRVATVTQAPTVPAGTAVFDYVLLGRIAYCSWLGRESSADLDAARGAIERLGLTRFANRPIETLSGGERQRVWLARALAQGAPLLLLDEPTSALDIGHQQEVLELVDELRRSEGITVLATTHDLTLAGEYADRLVLLADGRVAASGHAGHVLSEELLRTHYGASVRVIAGERGSPLVVPVRQRPAIRRG